MGWLVAAGRSVSQTVCGGRRVECTSSLSISLSSPLLFSPPLVLPSVAASVVLTRYPQPPPPPVAPRRAPLAAGVAAAAAVPRQASAVDGECEESQLARAAHLAGCRLWPWPKVNPLK